MLSVILSHASENGKRFTYVYTERLLFWFVFEEVAAGFHFVAYIHKNTDQAFSRASNKLRLVAAITLRDFRRAFLAFTPQ